MKREVALLQTLKTRVIRYSEAAIGTVIFVICVLVYLANPKITLPSSNNVTNMLLKIVGLPSFSILLPAFTMLIPIICFALGMLILTLAIPFWSASSGPLPTGFTRSNLVLHLLGYRLIAVALILGIIGYLAHFNGEWLRPLRLTVGLIGLAVLSYQLIEINVRP